MLMSEVDDHTCDRYTNGDCFLLAKKLSDFGLGQLVAVVGRDDWELWSHMAVKIGADSYLDVEGIWSSNDMLDNYARGKSPMKLMEITTEEYDELIEGQLPGTDSEQELETLASSLIDWAASMGVQTLVG